MDGIGGEDVDGMYFGGGRLACNVVDIDASGDKDVGGGGGDDVVWWSGVGSS